MLNWTSLVPDYWDMNFGRLLATMTPGSDVRGAGLLSSSRRFSTAEQQQKIEILQKVRTMLDFPDAIALVKRALFDRADDVRHQTLFLLALMDEAGANLTARLLLEDPDTDTSIQLEMMSVLTMNTKAPLAVPAILEVVHDRLSRPLDSERINQQNYALIGEMIGILAESVSLRS